MYDHNPEGKSNLVPWLLVAAGAGGVYYWYSKNEQEKKAKEQAEAGKSAAGTPATVTVVAGTNPVATVTPNATLTLAPAAGLTLTDVIQTNNPAVLGDLNTGRTPVGASGTAVVPSHEFEGNANLDGTLVDASGAKVSFTLPVQVRLPAKK
jgi:hypothetical protein